MSSSDSDSDTNRGHPRPPPPPPPMDKSKKKKKFPPQETINRIWQRFSAPKFSKATVILPFAPPSTKSANDSSLKPVPKSEHKNLRVSEDFDRAVQECRMRVRKLVKECKRVNMRYRDPDFDIDWDLKWERGFCLNQLSKKKFDLSGKSLTNPTSNVPKSVKRVHEIFEKPTFLKEKMSPSDIKQGSLGNCWLMSSLTALANMDVGIQRICVEYDTKIGIYGFVFHRDGEWIISIIDDKLYLKSPDWDSPSVQRCLLEQTDKEDVEREYRKTYQTGSQALFFAQCKDQNETWLPLLEKAYAKAHGDYASLSGGWIGEGVEDLTGGVTTELLSSDILDTDEFWSEEIMKVNKEFLFGCSTGLLGEYFGSRDGISERHAYVLMEARELSNGTRLVKLRNPWAKGKKGNWEGAWSDGSKELTPEFQMELNHKFGNDSVFWISYEDFLRKYQHFDRTRLFMDSPDWRITQKWISVEVPWKAEFEQRFRIVLKKETPVVLALSQLDDRYFNGLSGQYNFRLQFRLHEVNSPGENDYILRSHGNYLMERSVVTELRSLAAGTYSVFVMISADRDSGYPSVEDVVKSQLKRREENDKLAQVGMSYDLAHSKATVHMEARAAARKAQEKAKAREARIATRRKNWEKRRLGREIVRKQDKKNREKREAKAAKLIVEQKEKAEKEPKDQAVQTEDVNEVAVDTADKAIQTEDGTLPFVEPEKSIASQTDQKDGDKTIQIDTESVSSASQGIATPQSSIAVPDSPRSRSRSSHIVIGPPPPPHSSYRDRKDSTAHRNNPRSSRQQYIESEGESSASPISDFDDMYSDDDPTLKPRPNTPGGPVVPKDKQSQDDEDDDVEPWNAVAIVGMRLYTQDEGAELRIYDGHDDEEDENILVKEDPGSEADTEDMEDDEKGKCNCKCNHKSGDDNGKSIDDKDPSKRTGEDEIILINKEKEAMDLGTEESASASVVEEKSNSGKTESGEKEKPKEELPVEDSAPKAEVAQ